MTIRYTDSLTGITPAMLEGFFEGWPGPPSSEVHLQILRSSYLIVMAIDGEAGRVVGFINAISDGVLCAYIPLLEVLPTYRNKGIGRELVGRMVERLRHLYAVDVVCDKSAEPFYVKCGLSPARAMILRNHDRQSGDPG